MSAVSRTNLRIDKLTPEQEAQLGEWRDRWLAIGLSTTPADREAAESGVIAAYRAARLDPPQFIVWLRSPLEGAIAAYSLSQVWHEVKTQVVDQIRARVATQLGAQVGGLTWAQAGIQLGAQVGGLIRTLETRLGAQVGVPTWAQVRTLIAAGDFEVLIAGLISSQAEAQISAQVWVQVWDQVGVQIADQIRAQVADQIRAQVTEQIGGQVFGEVGARVAAQLRAAAEAQLRAPAGLQVTDQIRAHVAAQLRAQIGAWPWALLGPHGWNCQYGLHEACWVGFYDFFGQVVGLDCVTPLHGITLLTRSCGWWWPFRGGCILTERPCVLRRDPQHRLHSDIGPALAYADGWSIHAWHGVRVPAEVIEKPDTLTAARVLYEPNVEIRRAMLERIGWEKVWGWIGNPKPIHTDETGELYKFRLPNQGGLIALMRVVDRSTGRRYVLGVPPEMERARQAVAWSFGMTEDAWRPFAET